MTPSAHHPAHDSLAAWLAPLDQAPVECDGFVRLASILLAREGLEHEVHVGRLSLPGARSISPHFWIALPGGLICDYRARMWLGDQAPHGVFRPEPAHRYESRCVTSFHEDAELIFWVLSGTELYRYPPFVG